MYFTVKWHHNIFCLSHSNSSKFFHTIMMPNDIKELCEVLKSIYYQPRITGMSFSATNWLLYVTAKIGIFWDYLFLNWGNIKHLVTFSFVSVCRAAHLSSSFVHTERSCLASIYSITQKNAQKSVITTSKIAEDRSFWQIFCVKCKRYRYWNRWMTTIFKLTKV